MLKDSNSYIPYGAYWTTPFVKWQGKFANLHSLKFAALVAKMELGKRKIDSSSFDLAVLGMTVPQEGSFYGAPWLMGEIGSDRIGGPTLAQACATGARVLKTAAGEISMREASACLVVTADRTSNAPDVYYPAPNSMGGAGRHERWVLDNFDRDPYASVPMIQTAENVARKYDISKSVQDEWTLIRHEQYQQAKADDSAFLKRFMTLPFEVPDHRLKPSGTFLMGDEGVHETTADGLASLKPVQEGGSVSYGGQTHPADANAGIVVTSRERIAEFSSSPEIAVRLVTFGQARAEKGFMPAAPIEAARTAIERAGINISELKAIKTHNPFIVNDIAMGQELGLSSRSMNRYGSPLVWGHPISPTGLRCVIELIEELVILGGGYGLFTGCAAGDSAMAVVVHVGDSLE